MSLAIAALGGKVQHLSQISNSGFIVFLIQVNEPQIIEPLGAARHSLQKSIEIAAGGLSIPTLRNRICRVRVKRCKPWDQPQGSELARR